MNIPIGGFIHESLIEWPGRISACIFLRGCNCLCDYCHARELLSESNETISIDRVKDAIRNQIEWLDAIVVSGGEPTIHPDLEQLLSFLKEKTDLDILLRTNGTNPKILKRLIEEKIIDAVSVDFKGPLEKMVDIAKNSDIIDNINRTLRLLKNTDIEVTYRTTYSPSLLETKDFLKMGMQLVGNHPWLIQAYRKENSLKKLREPTEYEMNKALHWAERNYHNVQLSKY